MTKRKSSVPHFVYILQSEADGTFYVGSTSDMQKRLAKHNSSGSTYTRSRRPWALARVEQFDSAIAARQRERAIKARGARRYMEESSQCATQFDAQSRST